MSTALSQKQLDLFVDRSEAGLRLHLEDILRRPVALVLTENSTSMLSARIRAGVLHVRLHRMFLAADEPVLDDITSFLKHRRGSMPHFRRFLREQREQIGKKPPNRVLVRTQGKVYDLGELFLEINSEYFGGTVTAAITWGTRSARSSVRRRTLGSFSARSKTIRINPLLDRTTIPRYFIAFIVYHEMLHAAMGAPLRGARRSIHSREFRMRERCFRDYDKALAWERKKK